MTTVCPRNSGRMSRKASRSPSSSTSPAAPSGWRAMPQNVQSGAMAGAAYASTMSDSAVNLTAGVPETVLPPPPTEAAERLTQAMAEPVERRRDAVSGVVATFPRFQEGWARLGELARDDVEAYA